MSSSRNTVVRSRHDVGAAGCAAGDVPVEGGAVPGDATPGKVARTQQQLRVLQWVTPVLTGALIVLGAQQGEQQRPGQLRRGLRSNAG